MARPKLPKKAVPPATPVTPTVESRLGLHTATLIANALGVAITRVYTLVGAVIVGMAGLLLTVGWQAGPQKAIEAHKFTTYNLRAPAHIVESWLAVEFDPKLMGRYTQWRPFAKAAPCVLVEYTNEWAVGARHAFCGARLTFYDHYTLHDAGPLTTGVPFAWKRDERGFIAPEIRISSEAAQWLTTHAPASPLAQAKAPPGPETRTEMTELIRMLDSPVDAAIIGWSGAAPAFMLALDPMQPERPLPAGYVENQARLETSWMVSVLAFGIGLALWYAGISMIVAHLPRSLAWFIAIAPLLALPWWGDYFPRALRTMNASFAGVVTDMLGDVNKADRLVASAPEDAALADGVRIDWRVGSGAYADALGRFNFKRPQPPPANDDAALLALNDTIAEQLRGMDPATRASIFEQLYLHKKAERARAGYLFLRGAKEAVLDPASPPEVYRAARAFLEEWVTQPVEEPWPDAPGFEARVQLLQELTTIPPPSVVAIPAGWIVSRGEERSREARDKHKTNSRP